MAHVAKPGRLREVVRAVGVSLAMTILTLAALEIFLRVADFRELREGVSERSLSYRYDAELGWALVPGSNSIVTNARTIHVYPVHVTTRKSLGLMMRKLSVTESQRTAQFRGTFSRRKPSVASANWAQVA